MRIAMIAALAASLAGCAAGSGSSDVGSAQGVVGNERGGKIPYQDGGMSTAMNAATAHCRNFGKKAQVTKMSPTSEGMELAFECN